MTGSEISLPPDIMLGTFQGADRITAPEHVQKLQYRLGTFFNEVMAQLKKYRERPCRYYNLSTHGTEYKPDDLVLEKRQDENKSVTNLSPNGEDHSCL